MRNRYFIAQFSFIKFFQVWSVGLLGNCGPQAVLCPCLVLKMSWIDVLS